MKTLVDTRQIQGHVRARARRACVRTVRAHARLLILLVRL